MLSHPVGLTIKTGVVLSWWCLNYAPALACFRLCNVYFILVQLDFFLQLAFLIIGYPSLPSALLHCLGLTRLHSQLDCYFSRKICMCTVPNPWGNFSVLAEMFLLHDWYGQKLEVSLFRIRWSGSAALPYSPALNRLFVTCMWLCCIPILGKFSQHHIFLLEGWSAW